jgi:hypothetical protein
MNASSLRRIVETAACSTRLPNTSDVRLRCDGIDPARRGSPQPNAA